MVHWLKCQKPELVSMDNFQKKNESWISKRSKKIDPFVVFPDFLSSKLIIFIGSLNTYMKCHDPLSSIQQKLAKFYVPFWKKSGKTVKRVNFFGTFWMVKSYFFKNGSAKWVLVFVLQPMHQDASFKLSNIAIRQFSFFTLVRGYPY